MTIDLRKKSIDMLKSALRLDQNHVAPHKVVQTLMYCINFLTNEEKSYIDELHETCTCPVRYHLREYLL